MNGLPPEIKDQLLSSMAREPSLTRAEWRNRRGLWLAVSLAVLAAASLMRGVPRPSMDRPIAYLAAFGLAVLAIALPATARVLSPGGKPRNALRATVVAVPLLLVAAAFASAELAPAARSLGWPEHSMCLSLYAVLGGLLLAIGLTGIRPLDPIAPTTTGAAIGAAIGAWVTLAVSLQCPAADPIHVSISHVAPIVALTSIGAVLGGRLLARRRRA